MTSIFAMRDPSVPVDASPPDWRIDLDPDDVGRGLAEIVIAVLELLRELLERQAIRRVDAGDLGAAQTERLGSALRDVRLQLADLRQSMSRRDRDAIGSLLDHTMTLAGTDRTDTR
jgi:gas vesicle protein GvpK